ncbi:MAG: DNA repair exonuclease [Rhodothermales bacterium]|nr:DNA repair exonuclease [Rhodothermales bacterium]
MLKILHLADVHLDTIFASRSATVRQRLRESIRTALVRAIDLAIGERVDAVLIAGDLFDGELLSFTSERLIFEQIHRLVDAGIPGFYATGNHDPASMRTRAAGMEWPDGFHVFRTAEPEAVQIRSKTGNPVGYVVGAGHETAREEQNLITRFPTSSGATPWVGLAHTIVTSAASTELHDRYAPCEVDDLRKPGYDYWALGHVHTRQQVDDQANAWYPGNIVGRNPRETGPRGAIVARVERGKPALTEFVPLSPVEWYHLSPEDLSSISNASELETRVRDEFEAIRRQSAADDWIVVLDMQGPCPLEPDLRDTDRREELEELVADALSVMAVEIRTEKLVSPIDINAHRGQPHLLGETLALIDELRSDPSALLKLAPDPPGRAVGTEPERLQYLKELLTGIEDEAARRLLTDGGVI